MRHTTPQRLALTVASVQLFLALCWTIYVLYLPRLCAEAGIDASWVPWILVLDQAIFAVCDWAAGIWADRAGRVVGRIGKLVLAATVFSSAAFLALPFVAADAGKGVLIALIVVWSATSSALRAPPIVLLGRHAAKPRQPFLAALLLLGLGIAGAASPYLAALLRDVDARIPFVLASLALLAMTWVLSTAESTTRRDDATPRAAPTPAPPAHAPLSTLAWFLVGVALLGVGFQVHTALDSAPAYLRFAAPDLLESLMPLFWIGFSVGVLPASVLARLWGGPLAMAFGAVIGAAAAFLVAAATSLGTVIAAQLVAGAAWGCVLMSAVAAALALGRGGTEGKFVGGLFSALALATLLRIAAVAGGHAAAPAVAAFLPWTPTSAWLLAAMALLCMLAYGKARGA